MLVVTLCTCSDLSGSGLVVTLCTCSDLSGRSISGDSMYM